MTQEPPQREDSDDSTLMMASGSTPRPGGDGSPGGGTSKRWETRSGAILLGSIVGLAVAAVVAIMLVLLVPKDDDADADNGDEETPTEEANGTPAPVDFTGSWVTNFSGLELEQQGTSVSGEYSNFLDNSTPRSIKGVITGRTLEGTFDGDVNPFRFELSNDGRSFSGHWADPQGGLHEWCGSFDTPLPEGCGYSGEWRVKGFPPAADLDGDTILLTQYGDAVQMRFDSDLHGEIEFELFFDGTTLALATGEASIGNGTIEFQFLVTEDPDWNTLRGTWHSGSQSGQWCAAQGDSDLPC